MLIPGKLGFSPSGEYLENSVSAICLEGVDLVTQALQSITLLPLEEGYRGSHAFPYFNIHTFTSNGFGMINHHGEVDNHRIKTLWQALLAMARKFAQAYDDPKLDGVMDYTWFE